jgi:hypothetical protein
MSSSTSLTQTPAYESLEQVLEELARAIAGAQNALLGGRFRDLEARVLEQQDLCSKIERLIRTKSVWEANCARESARNVRRQNLVFAAALRRMRRHADVLRNLMSGPALSYHPTSGIGQVI